MIVQGKAETLTEKAAWLLFKEGIEKLLTTRETVVLAVPGGRSVVGVFRALRQYSIEWQRVHIFMLDERLVPITHEDSNYRLLQDELGDLVPATSLHPFIYDENDPKKSVAAYEETLKKYGEGFDIVFASAGEDGHIASLFPCHHLLADDYSGFQLISDSPKPPPGRITASRKLIEAAQLGLVMVVGQAKQEAMRNFSDPEKDVKQCPARIIASLPTWFALTDREVYLP